MTLAGNSWLAEHRRHCMALNLDAEIVKNNIRTAKGEVESLLLLASRAPCVLEDFIFDCIVNKLKTRLSEAGNVGLLCSGGEDSIYLLMALVRGVGKHPKLFCYETKNNSTDVARLKKIAALLDLQLHLFDSSNLDRQSAYEKFIASQGRAPNDLAQPVHNALYFEALDKHDCDVVIDGQFCDTVLLSNPQNHFLLWTEKYPTCVKLMAQLLRFLPLKKNSKLSSRIHQVENLLCASTPIEKILKLINVKSQDEEATKLIERLVEKFGIQLAFSICFFYCLLDVRERDKYLLCPDLCSPFDDFNFAVISSLNLEQVLGFFVRKRPIRNVCKKSFPSLFRFQNTLPFELE